MTAPTCGTCRWWVHRPDYTQVSEAQRGRCHIRSTPYAEFPHRFDTDFCGEHTPKGEANGQDG